LAFQTEFVESFIKAGESMVLQLSRTNYQIYMLQS